MNTIHHHTDPAYRRPLPDEVAAALQEESAAERPLLEEAWHAADSYVGGEPDEATFRALGAEIWQNLEAALEQERVQPASPPATPASPLRLVRAPLRLVQQPMRWAAVAACVALLLAVGLVLTNQSTSLEAPYGQQLTHTLPDGSTITLNSGTKLSYARSFGEETRTVNLTRGEVFFTVKKAEQPFSVRTFNGTVTVLGTAFNVRSWSSDLDATTEVAVESGTVQFASRSNPGEAVVLQAGQSARLMAHQTSAPVTLDTANTENALSWRAGSFKFSNHLLGTVVDELERRFDVRITVAPKSLRNTPIGILIENPLGAEEIIRDICGLDRCSYRAVPGGYEIAQPAVE